MDFSGSNNEITQARRLYAQAVASFKAQEETAALDLYIACTEKLHKAFGEDDLDSDEIASFVGTDLASLEEFLEGIIGATVRRGFIEAARSADKPAEALLHLKVIDNAYRIYGDEGMSFDQFCGAMGVKSNELADLKADIARRQEERQRWESGGAKVINSMVGYALRGAFHHAASYAKTNAARALKIIDAMEWVARKIGGEDRRDFYTRVGLDAGLIANMRRDLAPR